MFEKNSRVFAVAVDGSEMGKVAFLTLLNEFLGK